MKSNYETLHIPRALATRVLETAQRAEGKAIVGLMFGISDQLTRFCPLPNSAADPTLAVALTPDATKHPGAAHSDSETLSAWVYSVPWTTEKPRPLETFRDQDYHLIIALNTKGVLEIIAYRMLSTASVEIDLVIL